MGPQQRDMVADSAGDDGLVGPRATAQRGQVCVNRPQAARALGLARHDGGQARRLESIIGRCSSLPRPAVALHASTAALPGLCCGGVDLNASSICCRAARPKATAP